MIDQQHRKAQCTPEGWFASEKCRIVFEHKDQEFVEPIGFFLLSRKKRITHKVDDQIDESHTASNQLTNKRVNLVQVFLSMPLSSYRFLVYLRNSPSVAE